MAVVKSPKNNKRKSLWVSALAKGTLTKNLGVKKSHRFIINNESSFQELYRGSIKRVVRANYSLFGILK